MFNFDALEMLQIRAARRGIGGGGNQDQICTQDEDELSNITPLFGGFDDSD